jgi:hypothetical protein
MQRKNPYKMMEVGALRRKHVGLVSRNGELVWEARSIGRGQRKLLKRTHKKRSRRFLKDQLRKDDV